jgi:NAD(P)-dependent dehydrogenase (short-subunit alcohol dehydrogenase family)
MDECSSVSPLPNSTNMSASRPLRIFITGGARGIGRGLFRHFLTAGHKIFILDSNTEELKHVTQLADTWAPGAAEAQLSRTWKAVHCDLSDREQIKSSVEDLRKTFDGKLDVLINNAFATPHVWVKDRTMEDESDEIMDEWDKKIAVGLTAPFLLSRLCVPMLKAASSEGQPGCIINISSTRAYQSELNHEAYSAAKAGILGLTQSMAVSLGHRHKIRVNAIVPGWINVENESRKGDDEQKKWEDGLGKEDMEWHPAGRVGQVQDVAKAVEYLVNADFVTGQEVVVDGGVGRKMVYPE